MTLNRLSAKPFGRQSKVMYEANVPAHIITLQLLRLTTSAGHMFAFGP